MTSALLCGQSHPIPLSLLSPHFSSLSSQFFSNPIEKWRTRCHCSVSSSAQPSASLMSAWPLWSCPLMFWGIAFFPPFYPNSSAMKADLMYIDMLSWAFIASSPRPFSVNHFSSCWIRRAVLTGLTSNPHINDLHLDISGCEVRVHRWHHVRVKRIVCFFSSHPGYRKFLGAFFTSRNEVKRNS